MVPERRRKRSNFAGLALQYWLASIARRQGLFALVLADSAGLLVASNLRGPEAEELAALAPLLARPEERAPARQVEPELPVQVLPLTIDRARLYLCAVGDRHRAGEGARTAVGGVERILSVH